jgi:hypothetical protein
MATKNATQKPAKPNKLKDLSGKDVKGGGLPLI